jgi:peptide/nickel transport system permease protein
VTLPQIDSFAIELAPVGPEREDATPTPGSSAASSYVRALRSLVLFGLLLGAYRLFGDDVPGWLSVAIGIAAAVAIGRLVVHLGRGRFGPKWNATLWMSVAWLVLLTGAAALADFLPLKGPATADFSKKDSRPALSFHEPLGYDGFGRSNLSRVIYGARVSLGIGLGAAALGLLVGGLLGLIAGYKRGWTDSVISLFADSLLAFPPLILLIGLVAVLPKTPTTIALGIGTLTVPAFIRLSRANTLTYAQREFVLAAHTLGFKRRRILFREILPNVALPVMAYTFVVVALVIVAEGSLSYLGVGIQPPRASWGRMIADGQPRFGPTPHLVFVPSLVMFGTLLALNRIGEALRASLAPAVRR